MKKDIQLVMRFFCILMFFALVFVFSGCEGYSGDSLYTKDVDSVYLEMFENRGLRRGVEFEVTDALSKRIEAQTPYKIISNRDVADTIMSGEIVTIGESVAVSERETGRAIEMLVEIRAVVNWKNIKTGDLLIENMEVVGRSSYSRWQNQGFRYASGVAANNLAEKIVELMEKDW